MYRNGRFLLPDPEILRLYDEPRSQVEVSKMATAHSATMRLHTTLGRRMGLLEEVGMKKPTLTWGPRMKLLQLTERGKQYLRNVNW